MPLEQTKKAKAQRCGEHLSLHHANLEAAGLIERVKKGVAGKGWSMQPSVLSSSYDRPATAAAASGSGLYEGKITFDNGDVQFAWVTEEERYLGDCGGAGAGRGPSEIVKTGGYVRVDKIGVGVYRRKRFDVWSRVFVGREVRRERGGKGQRVVFECGGDQGGDGEGEHGDERNESEVGEENDGAEKKGADEAEGDEDMVEIEGGTENPDGNGEEREITSGDENRGEEKTGEGIGGDDGMEGEKADENRTPGEDNNANNTNIQPLILHSAQQTVEETGPQAQEKGEAEDEEEEEEVEPKRPEPVAATEDGNEIDEETSGDDSDGENSRSHRASSVSSTTTVTFPPFVSPLDVVDIKLTLHGTYTTISLANRAALATFLELAKPKNSSIEDNHHYQYELKPGITSSFEENGMGERNCTTVAEIPWDPPMGKQHRWEFLRLEVEVIESELKGPVDIGDMVVEGGGDEGQEERASDEVNSVTRQNKAGEETAGEMGVNVRRPARALPSPLEESEGEISEEE